MICKLNLNNVSKNGEQKECRKVGLGQVPMDKVYQFKTIRSYTSVTIFIYSSTIVFGY